MKPSKRNLRDAARICNKIYFDNNSILDNFIKFFILKFLENFHTFRLLHKMCKSHLNIYYLLTHKKLKFKRFIKVLRLKPNR